MLDVDKGSRFLGECAIGTNYDITRYTRNTLFDRCWIFSDTPGSRSFA